MLSSSPCMCRSLRAHRWEENHVTDVLGLREIHEQPVESDADAPRRRHAVLHRAQVILVHVRSLFVPRRAQPRLRLEAAALVDGVVQLTEGVSELAPLGEQLEPLRKRRVAALRLGERRELRRVIDYEGWRLELG